jgi:hypothetical protein
LSSALNNAQANIITINLALDYIGAAKIGEAVVITPRVLRAAGSIGFCESLASCRDHPIARANATFSVRISQPQ